jgi:hypothetical protein
MSDVEATLAARAAKYGDFTDLAITAQNLKDEARRGVGWSKLSGNQKEAIDMILHKVARVISGGDPHYRDNWHDIAGYAKMAEDRCDRPPIETFDRLPPRDPKIGDVWIYISEAEAEAGVFFATGVGNTTRHIWNGSAWAQTLVPASIS